MRTDIRLVSTLILVAVLLSSCVASYTSHYADPELEITVFGSSNESGTMITIKAVDFSITTEPQFIHWYYDVPSGENEYVIAEHRQDGEPPNGRIYIHQHESKRPLESKK